MSKKELEDLRKKEQEEAAAQVGCQGWNYEKLNFVIYVLLIICNFLVLHVSSFGQPSAYSDTLSCRLRRIGKVWLRVKTGSTFGSGKVH